MKRLTWIVVLFFAFTGLGALAASAQNGYGYRPAPRYYYSGYYGYRPAYYRHERMERRRFYRHELRERRRFVRHERRERWERRHGRW